MPLLINLLKRSLYPILITCFFIILFSYKLGSIPPNISGDETIYLNSAYQTMLSQRPINPFMLMEDHTKIALNFYWMGLWIELFGINNAIFAMRFSIALFGIGTLIAFYELMRRRSDNFASLLVTMLLGTSIWFMNFARSGWPNLISLFWGITMIYFFEKAIREQRKIIFFFSGILGGIACYSYLSGYIFPISVFIFLFFYIIKSRERQVAIKQAAFYIFGFAPTILPVVIMVISIKEDFILRPQVVFAFNSHSSFFPLLINQIIEIGKGLLFLDKGAIGKGVENLRYFPANIPVVDLFIKTLFISGIPYILYKFGKKPHLSIWPIVYLATLGTVGILTVDPPNLARTLLVLPCIYLLGGIMLFNIINYFNRIIGNKITLLIVASITLLVSYANVSNYFNWAKSKEVAYYRQPAINYNEFTVWQNYQINLIKDGKRPIVNQEWYKIRKDLLINN